MCVCVCVCICVSAYWLYLPLNFLKDWPGNLNIATEIVLHWVYSAKTKIKYLGDGCSRIFTFHSSST